MTRVSSYVSGAAFWLANNVRLFKGRISVFRSIAVLGLSISLAVSTADGQEWASKMFKVRSHDFGTVARNAKAQFHFELQNIYKEDVHIASVRTSCGCTEPHITKPSLKTWDNGSILAVFNTRAFLGRRSATVTVTIDKPFYAEVQLQVRGYIRGDVVFEPGEVNFGDIDQGTTAEKSVTISYAGRSKWVIQDVRSANPHFEVELGDPVRSYGRVTFNMVVRIKGDAPAGLINDQLTVVSNDSTNGTLELPVRGNVVSELTVSPTTLFLGNLKPGQSVTKKLIVRGKRPFKIVEIDCPDKSFEFKTSVEPRTMHLVPVTYTAGADAAKVSQKILIKTDLKDGTEACCTASATIVQAVVGKSDDQYSP